MRNSSCRFGVLFTRNLPKNDTWQGIFTGGILLNSKFPCPSERVVLRYLKYRWWCCSRHSPLIIDLSRNSFAYGVTGARTTSFPVPYSTSPLFVFKNAWPIILLSPPPAWRKEAFINRLYLMSFNICNNLWAFSMSPLAFGCWGLRFNVSRHSWMAWSSFSWV